MTPTQWNSQQNDFFNILNTTTKNIVLKARAGTGKTTTIVEGLKHLPKKSTRNIIVAFNRRIKDELVPRVGRRAVAKTLHSVGFAMCMDALGKCKVDKNKKFKIITKLTKGDKYLGEAGVLIRDIVSKVQNSLIDSDDLPDLCKSMNDCEAPDKLLLSVVGKVLQLCSIQTETIDYDDMIWLPTKLNLGCMPYHTVFVDEAQDLNPAQMSIIEKLLGPKGRLIAVGDERQCIYQFRGAEPAIFENMVNDFDATLLPLPITYRCGTSIVKEAQKYVPDYVAGPDNGEGVVRSTHVDEIFENAKAGDFILSRTNAPLMKICLQLLSEGRPSVILGRDIGLNLIALAKKSKKQVMAEVLTWLDDVYFPRCKANWLPEHRGKVENLQDKLICIQVLSRGMSHVEAFEARVKRLFNDEADETKITLSTIHKAKGLERDCVWLLEESFMYKDPSGGCSRWQGGEEDNIRYVAITRAKSELVYCNGRVS